MAVSKGTIGDYSRSQLNHIIKNLALSAVTVEEADGAPSSSKINTFVFPAGSVTLNAAGTEATITFSGGGGSYSHWVLEDNAGTEVNINSVEELKLVEAGGLDITWASPNGDGSDGDPFKMEFKVDLTDLSTATIATGDYLIIQDVDDSNNTKRGLVSDIKTPPGGSDTYMQYNDCLLYTSDAADE